MDSKNKLFNTTFVRHLIFWIIVFSIQLASNWDYFDSLQEMFHVYLAKFILQLVSAYICLWLVVPRYLAKNRPLELLVIITLLIFFLHAAYTAWRMLYLEPTYPETYIRFFEIYGHRTFIERALTVKLLFAKEAALYLFPALLLVAFQFYQSEQKYAAINEQKKIAELNALKNQLNPHFLFNSLNNLYTLALKKSDEAPEVISRLSDILDYMLYRTTGPFVHLNKEVELLENYLALEKIRYGRRVEIKFIVDITPDIQVAPLLFLTFVENAFKHGVTQEIDQANIDINLHTDDTHIYFTITNSIPKSGQPIEQEEVGIGLKNVRKQLELLYPHKHDLQIKSSADKYHVELKLHAL